MCFIEFFRLNCFSEETEFLFVSDYLYRSDGCFCLVGFVHCSAIYPYVDGFTQRPYQNYNNNNITRINQRSVPIKNSEVFLGIGN